MNKRSRQLLLSIGLVFAVTLVGLMLTPVQTQAQGCDSAAVAEDIVRSYGNSSEAGNAANQSCLNAGDPFWNWHVRYQADVCRSIDATGGDTYGFLEGLYYDFGAGFIIFSPEQAVTGVGQVVSGYSVPIDYFNAMIRDVDPNQTGSPYGCWYMGIGGNPNPTPTPPPNPTPNPQNCTTFPANTLVPIGVQVCNPSTGLPLLTVLNRCSYDLNRNLDLSRSEWTPGFECPARLP